ncbi:MAG: MopE-related protein, partial [Myxococcota bacterium]|nr:MopE-related protein [Myxococcota bacterium]
ATDALTWYADTESDGYGDACLSDIDCYQPTGYVSDDTDCDDTDANAFPGNDEVCDGVDNDCSGGADEGFDSDGDGVSDILVGSPGSDDSTGMVTLISGLGAE